MTGLVKHLIEKCAESSEKTLEQVEEKVNCPPPPSPLPKVWLSGLEWLIEKPVQKKNPYDQTVVVECILGLKKKKNRWWW